MYQKLIALVLCLTFLSSDLMAQKYSGSRSSGSRSSSSKSSSSKSSPSRSSSSSSSKSKSYTSPPKSTFGGSSLSKSSAQNSSKSKYTQSQSKSSTSSFSSYKPTPKAPVSNYTKNVVASKPKVQYTTQARTQRYGTVINNNYSHPYGYYASQPYINVGGGYSPIFWWMMMEWSADRRAEWMYHHQNTMNQTVYKETIIKDPELAAEIEKLKAANVAVNPEYVDKDFKDNPDLMYSQEYIQKHIEETTPFPWMKWILGIFLVCAIGYGSKVLIWDLKVTK